MACHSDEPLAFDTRERADRVARAEAAYFEALQHLGDIARCFALELTGHVPQSLGEALETIAAIRGASFER